MGHMSPAQNVGIVGLGYVGLPLAVAFAEEGCTVTGLDVSETVVAATKFLPQAIHHRIV